MKKQDSKLDNLLQMMENMMDRIQISNPSPDNMDSPKAQDPTTAVLANKKAPPLEGVHSTKNWCHVGSQIGYHITKVL